MYTKDIVDILHPFKGQTEEQCVKTQQFLDLVADTHGTNSRVLIVKSNTLRINTYKRFRDENTGKLVFLTDKNGEKVIDKRKGIDWTNPALFDLAGRDELTRPHEFAYPRRRKGEWVRDYRAPLAAVLAAEADEHTKFLFYPVLVEKKKINETKYTKKGAKYKAQSNYKTSDVTFARCAWVDVDGHNLPVDMVDAINTAAIENLLQILPEYCENTGVPMPCVVNSGRGIHLYWWFSEVFDIRGEEEKGAFRDLLRALTRWTASLIALDPVCAAAWDADSASSAVFHQLNLPGTVHPKTGKPRYVVNSYLEDYDLCDCWELFGLFGISVKGNDFTLIEDTMEWEELDQEEEEEPETPMIPEIVPVVAGNVAAVLPSDVVRRPYATGRLGRLLSWGAARGWNFPAQREKYLFICGAMAAQQGDGGGNVPPLDVLHDINALLVEPLPSSEVEKIVMELDQKRSSGTTAWEKYYCYKNESIAEFLGMSQDEAARYGFKSIRVGSCYGLPSMPSFVAKLAEIKAITPLEKDEEKTEWADRCYQLTKQWYKDHRKDHCNGARTRKRMEQTGYTGKAGRKADPDLPRVLVEIRQECPDWNMREIAEEATKRGHKCGKSRAAQLLKEAGF